MPNSQAPALVLSALVLVAVVLALLQVGGPGTARMEKRDAVRLEDLRKMSRYVACLAETAGGALPEQVRRSDACTTRLGEVRLTDPFTDLPYGYERLEGELYLLCAAFERPASLERTAHWHERFEASTSCLTLHFTPE